MSIDLIFRTEVLARSRFLSKILGRLPHQTPHQLFSSISKSTDEIPISMEALLQDSIELRNLQFYESAV